MKLFKKDLPFFVFALFLILVVSNLFAYKFFLYWRWWWLDIIIHTLGGVWLGFVMLSLLNIFGGITVREKSPTLFVIIVMSFASFGGMLWEFLEYMLKNTLQIGIRDTIYDLFFDTVGGLIAALSTFVRNEVD
ncbi:MAG TPA: hypothetical protein VJJ73_01970 [Candidatus Paceibacterota bacterium]